MNGTHLMVIALGAAALLGLHADAGSLFLFVASAAPTFNPGFAGYADLPGVRLWYRDSGGDCGAGQIPHANTGTPERLQVNLRGIFAPGCRADGFRSRAVGRGRA